MWVLTVNSKNYIGTNFWKEKLIYHKWPYFLLSEAFKKMLVLSALTKNMFSFYFKKHVNKKTIFKTRKIGI